MRLTISSSDSAASKPLLFSASGGIPLLSNAHSDQHADTHADRNADRNRSANQHANAHSNMDARSSYADADIHADRNRDPGAWPRDIRDWR